jgi:hypothetical protein
MATSRRGLLDTEGDGSSSVEGVAIMPIPSLCVTGPGRQGHRELSVDRGWIGVAAQRALAHDLAMIWPVLPIESVR